MFLNKFVTLFNNIKLKYKLAIVYVVVVIFPFCVFFSVIDTHVKNVLRENLSFSASNSYEQALTFLSYKLYNIRKAANVIACNETIRTILSKKVAQYSAGQQLLDMEKLLQILKGFEDKNDIIKARLYVKSQFLYSNENKNIFNLNSVLHTKWYNEVIQKGESFFPSHYLENDNKEILSFGKTILNSDDYTIVESVVRVDFDKEDILDIILKANAFKNSVTFVYNEKNELVLVSNRDLYENFNVDISYLHSRFSRKNGFNKFVQDNHTFLVQTRNIENSDWYMATIIPENDIVNEVNAQYNFLWLAMTFILIIIYIFVNLTSFTITRRIDKLIDNMNDVKKGKFAIIDNENANDEIGILTQNYNYMIRQLNILMEEKYKAGQQLKASEFKALQAQINPHFLYNTLEMINWLAKRQRTNDILTVTSALSNLYKISLSKGEDLITIQDELLHVESYIKIQNMRFDNKINLITEIDKSLLNYKIPKIILQPLVENSIFHGILEKEEQSGTIIIKVYSSNNHICLEVIDDGVGIPEEKLNTILLNDNISSKSGSHYGLKNIFMRLKLMSEDNNLIISSKKGVGTKVKILISHSISN